MSTQAAKNTDADANADLEQFTKLLQKARAEIKKVIFGQDEVIDQILISLISGGHVLLMGVPGLAKTKMVETVAIVLGLDTNRIQCTPDLMPADILGSEVLEEDEKGKRAFRFIEGPVFTQFLMADEINRASPRTQSALLQAMQEGTVTIAGKERHLPKPFHVLATQNPLEQEGTYPLPEAQVDRFLMRVDVTYPDYESEREVVLSTTNNSDTKVKKIFSKDDLLFLQSFVRGMPIGDTVVDAILKLVRDARPDIGASDLVKKYVAWPPGPRASQALILTCRARALLDGRSIPSIDDIIALAKPVLQHRMALSYQAAPQSITVDTIIDSLTKDI